MSTGPAADLDPEKQAVEISEERTALNTVCRLQRWARDNEVLINYNQLLSHLEESQSPGRISQSNLVTGLIQLGFQAPDESKSNLMVLSKLLVNYSHGSDYLIDINQLFADLLQGAQLLNLQRAILSNSFSLRHLTRAGTEAVLGCDYAHTFLHEVVVSKVEDDIGVWRQFVDSLSPGTTEVSQLLRLIADEKLQMTKLEVQLLVQKLQDPTVANQVSVELLRRFVESPSAVLAPAQARLEERATRKKDLVAQNGIQDCQEVQEVVRTFLRKNCISLDEWVNVYNPGKSSFLQSSQFEKIMTRLEVPASRLDIKQLFNFLASGQKSLQPGKYLAIADAMRYLTTQPEADQPAGESPRPVLHAEKPLDYRRPEESQSPDRLAAIPQRDTQGTTLTAIRLVEHKENDDLAANSIIKLEDQLSRQTLLQASGASLSPNGGQTSD